MKVIYGLSNIRRFKKPVVALGVFDGVHRGHRFILKEAVKRAHKIKGTSIAVTFYPHPQKEKSLYSLKHRLRLISELGIDACIIIKFNRAFAGISAVNFIKEILVAKIGAVFVCVGKNFRFGKSAQGDTGLLEKLSKAYNYKLKVFDVVKIRRRPVSSTYIRELITKGKLVTARQLLLMPVSILGTVVKGISLARKIGFPTANIDPHHEIMPPSGVYFVRVILKNKRYFGLCNIGRKPTVIKSPGKQNREKDKHIEVYIFNFKKNIYERDLEIQFLQKMRDEKKFASIGLLAEQIKKDIHRAKRMVETFNALSRTGALPSLKIS